MTSRTERSRERSAAKAEGRLTYTEVQADENARAGVDLAAVSSGVQRGAGS